MNTYLYSFTCAHVRSLINFQTGNGQVSSIMKRHPKVPLECLSTVPPSKGSLFLTAQCVDAVSGSVCSTYLSYTVVEHSPNCDVVYHSLEQSWIMNILSFGEHMYSLLLCVYWEHLRIINNLYWINVKVLKGSVMCWNQSSLIILFSL